VTIAILDIYPHWLYKKGLPDISLLRTPPNCRHIVMYLPWSENILAVIHEYTIIICNIPIMIGDVNITLNRKRLWKFLVQSVDSPAATHGTVPQRKIHPNISPVWIPAVTLNHLVGEICNFCWLLLVDVGHMGRIPWIKWRQNPLHILAWTAPWPPLHSFRRLPGLRNGPALAWAKALIASSNIASNLGLVTSCQI
jgi:hypothetical protein